METVLRSYICLPEGTVLVAVETEAGKEGLERESKVDLDSAWHGCACSEEEALGMTGEAESLFCTEMQWLRNSGRAGRYWIVLHK